MNKQDLYALAYDSAQELDKRYEAARTLQEGRVAGDIVTYVVRLYPHWTPAEIAEKLKITVETVNGIAGKYGLAGRGS